MTRQSTKACAALAASIALMGWPYLFLGSMPILRLPTVVVALIPLSATLALAPGALFLLWCVRRPPRTRAPRQGERDDC